MLDGDDLFALTAGYASRGLQNPKCDSRCAAGTTCDEGQHCLFNGPGKCLAPMPHHFGQFFLGQIFHLQNQTHSFTQRKKNPLRVSSGEEQAELRERNCGLDRSRSGRSASVGPKQGTRSSAARSAVHELRPIWINSLSEAESRSTFISAGPETDCPKSLVQFDCQFLGDHGGPGALPQPRRPTEQRVGKSHLGPRSTSQVLPAPAAAHDRLPIRWLKLLGLTS